MDSVQELLISKDTRLAALQEQRLKLLQQGRELFDLSMFNPDLPPDRELIDYLVQASLRTENHRYAVSRGIKKLRVAFATKYHSRFGGELDAQSQVCATMGSKEAINLALLALAQAGAVTLVGAPTYPAHRAAVQLSGMRMETFDVITDESAMLSQIEQKFSAGKIKVCLTNFPNNPTAVTVSADFWRRLISLGRKFGVFIINDFAYGEMGHEVTPVSLLSSAEFEGVAAESYTLSKSYSVPGWRVGALLGDSNLISKISQLKSFLDYGNFLPIQIAASAALSSSAALTAIPTRRYERRARVLCEGLSRLGWSLTTPKAGACVWAKAPAYFKTDSSTMGNSYDLSELLLKRLGVFALPGEVFGPFPQYLRFALVIPEERIRQCVALFEHCEEPGRELQFSA